MDALFLSNPGFVLGLAAIALAALKFVIDKLTCEEVFGRHSFKRNQYAPNSFRRQQLDRLRMQSGQFPKPFPNGWYKVCDSEALPIGKVVAKSLLGREFVVFRGKDGRAAVLDAFCPHLGTHLGHGGFVSEQGNLTCPYHLWQFDADGKNKDIPYCPKDMSGSERVNIKSYPVKELKHAKAVFFWFHADGKEPDWDVHPGVLSVDQAIAEGKMRSIHSKRWGSDMLLHVMEPSQNSADSYHFKTVHRYLPMPFNLRIIKVDHVINTEYGSEGGLRGKDVMMIREGIENLWLFGWIRLPSFIKEFITTHVEIQGPNNVLFRVDTPLGKCRAHFSMLPVEPFRQEAWLRMYADNSIPWIVARLLQWWIMETVDQDRQVWEHKSQISPRNIVVGDGPFAAYGRWLKTFYSEKSEPWQSFVPNVKANLDW